MIDADTSDVPKISVEWYQDIVDFAADTPQPVQWFAEHFTEGAILLLGALWLIAAVSRLGAGRATARTPWCRRRRWCSRTGAASC